MAQQPMVRPDRTVALARRWPRARPGWPASRPGPWVGGARSASSADTAPAPGTPRPRPSPLRTATPFLTVTAVPRPPPRPRRRRGRRPCSRPRSGPPRRGRTPDAGPGPDLVALTQREGVHEHRRVPGDPRRYRHRVTAATAVLRARGTSQNGDGGGEHGAMAVLRTRRGGGWRAPGPGETRGWGRPCGGPGRGGEGPSPPAGRHPADIEVAAAPLALGMAGDPGWARVALPRAMSHSPHSSRPSCELR